MGLLHQLGVPVPADERRLELSIVVSTQKRKDVSSATAPLRSGAPNVDEGIGAMER
jgi:hypothetical protein